MKGVFGRVLTKENLLEIQRFLSLYLVGWTVYFLVFGCFLLSNSSLLFAHRINYPKILDLSLSIGTLGVFYMYIPLYVVLRNFTLSRSSQPIKRRLIVNMMFESLLILSCYIGLSFIVNCEWASVKAIFTFGFIEFDSHAQAVLCTHLRILMYLTFVFLFVDWKNYKK